jgi:hypothetical protein
MNHYKNGTWSNEMRPPLQELTLTQIGHHLREETMSAPSLYLTMIKKDQGWRHFHQLENLILEQQQEEGKNGYFVWNINSIFYDMDLFYIPENTTMPPTRKLHIGATTRGRQKRLFCLEYQFTFLRHGSLLHTREYDHAFVRDGQSSSFIFS